MSSILLIDDDVVLRTMLARYLRRNRWEVWEAEDGETGIELARQHHPAAVLCDLLLPRLNGMEVCSSIRQSLTGTRLIAMSSKSYAKDRGLALQAGAEEFLLKPVSPAALLELLARLKLQPPPHPESASPAVLRKSASLKFWGVRGSIAAPGPETAYYGGNTPCVEIRNRNTILILDSGTGIRLLGAALAEEFKERPLEATILLTHTHWDHIQGFPFFAPVYNPNNRIRVLGYEGARDGLAKILSSQMESPLFPIGLNQLPGHISIQELKEMRFAVENIQVQTIFANHPGVCVGYRLLTEGGAIVYLPDNEPYARQRQTENCSPEERRFAQDENRKLLDFIDGAQVLILDAQYDCEEYKAHQGWGHGCVEDAVDVALQARVRRLFLFHHDPNHHDLKISQMVECARNLVAEKGGELEVQAAREGTGLELPPLP